MMGGEVSFLLRTWISWRRVLSRSLGASRRLNLLNERTLRPSFWAISLKGLLFLLLWKIFSMILDLLSRSLRFSLAR